MCAQIVEKLEQKKNEAMKQYQDKTILENIANLNQKMSTLQTSVIKCKIKILSGK